MDPGSEISAEDAVAIRRLIAIDYYEIRDFSVETRLRFNALSGVRTFVLFVRTATGAGEIELFHWVVADEWELIHSTVG